jgi:hypothetical protein
VEDTLIDTIIETMRLSDIERIHEILMTLRTGHIDARGLMEQILYRLRDILFRELQSPLYPIYQEIFDLMMEGHSKLRSIPDGMMLVEITFLKIVKRGVLGEYQKTV